MSEQEVQMSNNQVFEELYFYQNKKEEAMKLIDLIDANYEDGYFFIRAAQHNDLNLLKLLYQKDSNVDLYDCLLASSRRGYIEIVKFLVEKGVDYRKLRDTYAWSLYESVNQYLETLPK